ncbi:MAG: hypothetical protein U9Q81_25760 [Pseudomonadota bacterium]|nr:hypothetical protein [Pseudomonadota bacterium]
MFAQKARSDAWFPRPSLRLLEAARKQGVGKFLFVSSTSAAVPDASADSMSRGIRPSFWPHLCNVVRIENRMRELAGIG